ncbi:MAG: acyl-CoA thioesterase [Janthinobacterium lividum]
MPFTREITPRFNQLDPAGILFFGEIFTLCSGIYEDFIQSLGFEWKQWFDNPSSASPVRHAEADYLRPLEGGQVYEVRVEILSLGTSSFEVGYTIRKLGITHCVVRLVHVFIDGQTRTKIPVPAAVREAFTKYGIRPVPEAPS